MRAPTPDEIRLVTDQIGELPAVICAFEAGAGGPDRAGRLLDRCRAARHRPRHCFPILARADRWRTPRALGAITRSLTGRDLCRDRPGSLQRGRKCQCLVVVIAVSEGSDRSRRARCDPQALAAPQGRTAAPGGTGDVTGPPPWSSGCLLAPATPPPLTSRQAGSGAPQGGCQSRSPPVPGGPTCGNSSLGTQGVLPDSRSDRRTDHRSDRRSDRVLTVGHRHPGCTFAFSSDGPPCANASMS